MRLSRLVFGVAAICLATAAWAVTDDDPNYWLSDIHGEKALAWAKAQNEKSEGVLKADPRYAATREAILKSLDVKDRIPLGDLDHGKLYNFWQDADHVRGLWRRAPMAEYRKADPNWEVLLDVDRLDADKHAIPFYQHMGAELVDDPARADAMGVLTPRMRYMLPDSPPKR